MTMNLVKNKQTKENLIRKKLESYGIHLIMNQWTSKKLEVVYSKSNISQEKNADMCNSSVAYTQNKLLTFANPSVE